MITYFRTLTVNSLFLQEKQMSKQLDNRKNILFIVCGPSGSGKGTFIDYAVAKFGDQIKHVPTYTTREPRPKEVPGKDYNFINQAAFDELISNGGIFEYTRTYGDYMYGSPRCLIQDELKKHLVVELDYKGMFRLQSVSDHRVISVFIMPPDIKTLLDRINKRYKEKNLEARIAMIKEQLQFAWAYDYVIINDGWDQYKKDIDTIIRAEMLRTNGLRKLLADKHSADPTLKKSS